MALSGEITLRIQTSDGMKRIDIPSTSSLKELYEEINKSLKLDDLNFAVFKERNFTKQLISDGTETIEGNGLKHGDIVYFKNMTGTSANRSNIKTVEKFVKDFGHTIQQQPSTGQENTNSLEFKSTAKTDVVEDDVDVILIKNDGRIKRSRDNKLCRHNLNGCCVHCSAIEPYDETYLKEQKIKHLSFNSYLRKQTSGIDRGKFVPFEDINCRIKPGCREHLPWPRGICSKCQPSAITLNRQIYRHVDNVMFENTELVERFLNYWRTTGHQRMGFLYGTYEQHTDVPLGIRARVAVIYEPPQDSSRDSLKLLEDEHAIEVDEVANLLGLKRIGWIFTDLISEDVAAGTVKQIRGIETHFLTAQECIMAGHLQNANPNSCRYASNGIFGSKFVTVCVTGDKTKQVHMEGYAVSAQCMALVRDECLIPTKDAPELGYIRESSENQFVPDVYYKEKDQYGNEVQCLARPLPVEYLLVDVPASTPLTPIYTFISCDRKESFPVENRYIDGHLQDFNTMSTYLSKWTAEQFLEAVSDFHFLLYIYKMDMLPMKANMKDLFQAVKNKDKIMASEFKKTEVWATLETLISASSGSTDGTASYPGDTLSKNSTTTTDADAASSWTCNHCTFINRSDLGTCEMCGLPR